SAALAGAATGAWFLPTFGAYYHDYVSYFLALLAVWAIIGVERPGWRAALAGAALALAFHAKQTFGASAALAFAIADVAFAGRRDGVLLNRRLLPFAGGYLGGHLLVLAGLAACGGLGNWWVYSVQVPADFAADSAQDKSFANLWKGLLWPFKIDPTLTALRGELVDKTVTWLFAPVLGLVYALYLAAAVLFLRQFLPRRWAIVGGAALLIPFVAAAVTLGLKDEAAASCCGLALAAVAAVLAGGVLARGGRREPAGPAPLALAMLLLTTVLCASNSGRRCTELGLGLGGALAVTAFLALGRRRWPAVVLLAAFTGLGLALAERDRHRAYDLRRVVLNGDVGDLAPIEHIFNAEGRPWTPEQEIRSGDMAALARHLAQAEGRFAVLDEKGFFLPLLLRRGGAVAGAAPP